MGFKGTVVNPMCSFLIAHNFTSQQNRFLSRRWSKKESNLVFSLVKAVIEISLKSFKSFSKSEEFDFDLFCLRFRVNQIDSSTVEGNIEFVHSQCSCVLTSQVSTQF